ncbi:MAG: hypothetical protein M1828_004644 [Chrysothrix sp. TS-e1954]|nr:MAG: hypothetical protein M1828_004644 [Chrysothrix sp. TS-e1954]
MDGLLIDSEDLYTIFTNEVLREYGKPDLPWNIKAQMQGRPAPEAGRIFEEWAQLPITREEFMAKTSVLQRKYFPQTKPLPGALDLVKTLSKAKHLDIVLATSSHRGTFQLKTDHLSELFSAFSEERRVLGDDPRIPRGQGKPAPDIYLLALKIINDMRRDDESFREVKPEECLVFEDSVPGVEAGRRAGMQVVWVPHPGLLEQYKSKEKEVLAGLTGEQKGDVISPKVSAAGQTVAGGPGSIDDSKAILLSSLEDFPYNRYGIEI